MASAHEPGVNKENMMLATKDVTAELLDLERQFWDAMKDKDAAGAARMTDDGCIVVGAQGVAAIDKKTMGKMLTEAEWELRHYTFDDQTAQVRLIGDDVAIVAYKANERVVVDGKPITFDVNDATAWLRRNGHWVAALHTETLIGDPFGRDKVASSR
jgi:hypothetical protein